MLYAIEGLSRKRSVDPPHDARRRHFGDVHFESQSTRLLSLLFPFNQSSISEPAELRE